MTTPSPSAREPTRSNPDLTPEGIDTYDAGLLGDGGGGNVEWWQDYVRAELERAHEFYAEQFDQAAATQQAELTRLKGENERLREGLKPFAQAAESLDETARDTDHCWESPSALSLFAGDLRRAAALVQEAEGK